MIFNDVPGFCFFGKIVLHHKTGCAPHISRRVFAPFRNAVFHFSFFKRGLDKRGNVLGIVVRFYRRVEERFGIFFQFVLRLQFHNHIFGRAEEIVCFAQRDFVVHRFVVVKLDVFYFYAFSCLFFVPFFEIFDHGFVVAFAVVDVFRPTRHAQGNVGFFAGGKRRQRSCGKCGNQSKRDEFFHCFILLSK